MVSPADAWEEVLLYQCINACTADSSHLPKGAGQVAPGVLRILLPGPAAAGSPSFIHTNCQPFAGASKTMIGVNGAAACEPAQDGMYLGMMRPPPAADGAAASEVALETSTPSWAGAAAAGLSRSGAVQSCRTKGSQLRVCTDGYAASSV